MTATTFSDFLFYAAGSGSTGPNSTHASLAIDVYGGTEAQDASVGRAAAGHAINHSTIPSPLSTDATVGGTYGRTWSFLSASNYTGTDWQAAIGAGYLKSAAGGDNYPTSNATDGNTEYSVRGFIRLHEGGGYSAAGNETGTTIGLFHKGYHADGTTQYGGETNSQDSGHTITDNMNGRGQVVNAYMLCFSNANNVYINSNGKVNNRGSFGAAGSNAAPTLKIIAANKTISSYTGGSGTTCSGTYALDTWYHVRFDMTSTGGHDVLKVYTAPTSGAGSADVAGLGKETWTEVGSLTVQSTDSHFRAWNDSDNKYSGYWYCHATHWRNAQNDHRGCNPMIDRFQFLTKDLS